MIERKSGLERHTLQTWLLHVILLGLVILVSYLTIGLVTRSPKDAAPPAEPKPLLKIPRVGVLNGCGERGIAFQMADYLRKHKIDVVEVGNHNSFDVEESIVVDRVGDLDAARYVAAVLGIPLSNVIQQVNREILLDISIVVGKDYHELKAYGP